MRASHKLEFAVSVNKAESAIRTVQLLCHSNRSAIRNSIRVSVEVLNVRIAMKFRVIRGGIAITTRPTNGRFVLYRPIDAINSVAGTHIQFGRRNNTIADFATKATSCHAAFRG